MKKIILWSIVAMLFTVPASAKYYHTTHPVCDEREMMVALDRATVDGRAVITTVTCEHSTSSWQDQTTSEYVYDDEYDYAPIVVDACDLCCNDCCE